MPDYARINKSINFDQLNAKMHEAEHKDAQQLRVKHDWTRDGKVQMASKLKSEGKWPGWSGRSKKLAKRQTVRARLVQAFHRGEFLHVEPGEAEKALFPRRINLQHAFSSRTFPQN